MGESHALATSGVGTRRLVSWFAVAALIHSTYAFFPIFGEGAKGRTSPAVLVLWGLAYALAAALWLNASVRRRGAMLWPAGVMVFVVLALLSATWSVAPELTLRRSVALAGTVAVGLVIAHFMRPVEVLDAIRRAMLIVALASLILYLVGYPESLDPVYGTLRGVLAQKNALGRALAVGLLASLLAGFLDPPRWRRRALSVIPMVVALALSGSAGGVVLAVIGAVAVTLVGLWRSASGRVPAVLAGMALLGCLFGLWLANWLTIDDVLGVFGRSSTLTGRTGIWTAAFEAMEERPIVGYGYGAFWTTDAAQAMSSQVKFEVVNAHNGFLDVGLGLGLIGVAAAFMVLVSLLLAVVRDYRIGDSECAAFRAFVFALVLASTVTESGLLTENSLLTVMLVVACAIQPNRPWMITSPAAPLSPDQVTTTPRSEPGVQSRMGRP